MRISSSFSKNVLIAACIPAVLLAACGPATPTPTPVPTLVGSTTCSPGQLVAPALASPAMWEVVSSLSPTLSWSPNDPPSASYPYPYGDCHPGGYDVTVSDSPSLWGTELGNTDPGVTTWVPTSALLPGREYKWRVSATSGGTDGPSSNQRIFFTGPMCATSALVAPQLIGPPNGSLVPTLNPSLSWQYPNPCLPQGYRVDLSVSPTFADTSLSGGTGNPSTTWGPGADLADCTWYYWRVAPINDTTLGPFSITRSFMTHFGSGCSYTYPTPTATPTPLGILPILPTVLTKPPLFDFDIAANCRKGPGSVYGVVTSYLVGQSFEADGRNEAGTWVRLKVNLTARCWVSTSAGHLEGDLNGLSVLPDPPTPIPTVPVARPTATPTKGRNFKP